MAKLTLNTIGSRYGSIDALNDNFNAIEAAIENTLSLDGTSPNALLADLDMNSQDILNAGEVSVETLRINGVLVEPTTGLTAGAAFQTYEYTATAGQTTFSVAPATPYNASIVVIVNGLQLSPTEVSVSSTNVLTPAMTLGDEVVIRRYTAEPVAAPDASEINFIQAGTGAVTRTSQDKMRDIFSRSDYTSDLNYNTAKIGKFGLNASFGAEIPADSTINGFSIGNGPNTGSVSSVAQNQRFGKSSMLVNTTGYSLLAIGYETLSSNTIGYNNTAIGRSALRYNLGGINNTAVGVVALESNTSGSGNTSIGVSALVTNTTGSNNTGLGFKAGFSNLSASGCTAVGTTALELNIVGANNTAVGYEALALATGASNTAVGMDAGINVTTGANNVAVGKSALFASGTGNQNVAVGSAAVQGVANFSNTTGVGYNSLSVSTANGNTAIGSSAGSSNTTGSNNLFVGYLSGTDAVDTVTTGNNRIVVGNNSHTSASIKVAWTVTSDARDKTSFAPIPHGLAFVSALQPTAFQFKETRDSTIAAGPLRYGFKAQDILELEGLNPVIINADDLENLKYNESSLVPILVKAIQELLVRVSALEKV